MKIVHVLAKNMQMFIDAVEGTDCRLNASQDIEYLINSFQNFNARDVLGLVVFANPITKKCIKLVSKFDSLFVFRQMPIILISDNITDVWNQGFFKVENSKVFLVQSEDNSISDVEIRQIFTTLLAFSDSVYDLSACPLENKKKNQNHSGQECPRQMSEQLSAFLNSLNRSDVYANCSRHAKRKQELAETS